MLSRNITTRTCLCPLEPSRGRDASIQNALYRQGDSAMAMACHQTFHKNSSNLVGIVEQLWNAFRSSRHGNGSGCRKDSHGHTSKQDSRESMIRTHNLAWIHGLASLSLKTIADEVKFQINMFQRTCKFWVQVVHMYTRYKWTQMRVHLVSKARNRNTIEISDATVDNETMLATASKVDGLWSDFDYWCANRIYTLSTDLRGFFVKVAQFLGSRGDFLTYPYIEILSTLADQVPPIEYSQVRRILQEELLIATTGYPSPDHVANQPLLELDDIFESIQPEPLGSATIAQTHKATLRSDWKETVMEYTSVVNPVLASMVAKKCAESDSIREVVIKVQYPDAERVMVSDLVSIRALGAFLQKTELDFDVLSPIDELSSQIRHEFDFRREAKNMHIIRKALAGLKGVRVPKEVDALVTRRMLVMSFEKGVALTKLASELRNLHVGDSVKKYIGSRVLQKMGMSFGKMMFERGILHADPMPGNILFDPKDASIVILDYGQVKHLESSLLELFARLVVALHARNPKQIHECMTRIGIETERAEEFAKKQSKLALAKTPPSSSLSPEEKLAYTMFDTKTYEGVDNSPFGENSAMREIRVNAFPQDLFFVLRVCQVLRGMSIGFGCESFSLVDEWRPYAEAFLRKKPNGVP